MDSNSYVDNSQQGGEFGKIGIKYEKDHVTYLCAGMICESENISKIICEYRNDIEVITKNNRRKSYQIKYTSSSVIPFSKICDAVKLFKALNNVERYHEFVLVSNKNFTNKDMQEFVSYQFKDREDLNDLEARIQKKFSYSLDEKFLSKLRMMKGPEISSFNLVNSSKLNCISNTDSVLASLSSIIDNIWIGLKDITDFNIEEFKTRQRKHIENKIITLARIKAKIPLEKKALKSADELTENIRKYIQYMQSLVNKRVQMIASLSENIMWNQGPH